MTPIRPLLALGLCGISFCALAQEHNEHGTVGPYAGLQSRAIKSLSDEDIAELVAGGGWGLALPAELNGHPGPAHLLELRVELDLTDTQIAQIEAIHTEMRAEAIAVGQALIAAEAELSAAFDGGTPSPDELEALIQSAEAERARLRMIHLSRHLQTPPLLTSAQIDRYNVLRGYQSDPCASVPEGHDADMWKRHNGCK